jgi:hypothetical protein
MMFLLLLILCVNVNSNFSFKNQNLNTFLLNPFSNHYNKNNVKFNSNSNDGYDHRFNPFSNERPNISEDENKLYNITLFFKKKYILDLLTDEKISIYIKIGILRENVIYSPNIYEGGLMKDFDFPPF